MADKIWTIGNKDTPQNFELEPLRYKFTSQSKYIHIWNEIKKHGMLTVVIPKDSKFQTVTDAVKRLKIQDFYFKVYCDLILGYQYHLIFEDHKQTILFKLKDVEDKLSELNFN